jgi:hypothetical protein
MDAPTRLALELLPQPSDDACGPTALHGVYRFWRDEMPLDEVVAGVPRLDDGGTIAASLGAHALQRGFRATLYTFNLRIFDPSWFDAAGRSLPTAQLLAKLRAQAELKSKDKLNFVTEAFAGFLQSGGSVRFEDLNGRLIARILRAGRPIIVGLSSTYLYKAKRETRRAGIEDDVAGYPSGHFVVLHGYDPARRTVDLADPLGRSHTGGSMHYQVTLSRLTNAILLGVLTYDGNLLVIEPGPRPV